MGTLYSKGIDISHWDGYVDFVEMKRQGYTFAIIKAGGDDNDRPYSDNNFDAYYNSAYAVGIDIGAYYFNSKRTFNSFEKGKQEAEHFIQILGNRKFTFPVFIDIEEHLCNFGKDAVTQAAKGFCETMERYGWYVGIYASVHYFNSRMNKKELDRYDFWVASWSKYKPTIGNVCIWQFGGESNKLHSPKLSFVSAAACDQNYSYINYPKIMNTKHFNNC